MKILPDGEIDRFINDGYMVARGLLPPDLVAGTRAQLLAAMEIDPNMPNTWTGKTLSEDPAVLALTAACRTADVEAVAEQLVGPRFLRGTCLSPYLEARNVMPATIAGYIPVLNFPVPGPREFERPAGYHIDGLHRTTLWPELQFLVIFAYLSDVTDYGGATTVLPGSHRQILEHWVKSGCAFDAGVPALPYSDPLPLSGAAGDVLFLHYLTAHSGSANHSTQIRIGLNSAVMPDPAFPYQRRSGGPDASWTPLDYTLRTDPGSWPGGAPTANSG